MNDRRVQFPCKDCKERHEGCHAECEKYKECTKICRELAVERHKEGVLNSWYKGRKFK